MREKQRRVVCRRLEVIEEELAAQLLESYAGRGPIDALVVSHQFADAFDMYVSISASG